MMLLILSHVGWQVDLLLAVMFVGVVGGLLAAGPDAVENVESHSDAAPTRLTRKVDRSRMTSAR